MTRAAKIEDDPVVEEVRAIRADMWREAGGTVAGLLSLLLAKSRAKRKPIVRAKTKRTTRRPKA